MNSIRGLLSSLVLCVLLALAYGQLTFSPYWGKRSGNDGGVFDTQKGNCKNANDVLVDVFRFMQMQAQLYVDCNHKE